MNYKTNEEIVLASQSPRRQQLLKTLNVPFQVVTSEVVEHFELKPKDLDAYVTNLAVEKAVAVAKEQPGRVVIGADTIVSYQGVVYPKPRDNAEAKLFLQTLSGKTHTVMTAVALVYKENVRTFISKITVTFYELDDMLIDAYVQTGDPLDKAGAYGIQSGGSLFVEKIDGDYYAVMGLPIAKLAKVLREMGIIEVEGCVMKE